MKTKAVRHHTLTLLLFFVSLPVITEISLNTLKTKSIVKEIEITPPKESSILYVGDVMLGRNVEKMSTYSGFGFAFKEIKNLFLENTYVIANLEGPIPQPTQHKQTPSNGFSFSFKDSIVSVLSAYHVSAVSLANNHTSDQGEKGYEHTVSALSEKSIASFGHSNYFMGDYISNNLDGKKIITLGINLITPKWDEASTISGVNSVCKNNKDALVFAFIHAGTEYEHNASRYQVDFAHKLIDETCVHTIVGSHPHVVQGIELYKDHYIFYSLGNFIFDQYFSKQTQEGYVLQVKNKAGLLTYTIIPIYQELSVPKVAEGETKSKIMNDILSNSSEEVSSNLREGSLTESVSISRVVDEKR